MRRRLIHAGSAAILAGSLLVTGHSGQAADIRTHKEGDVQFVIVSGAITKEDGDKFDAAVRDIRDAIVILSGPGGHGPSSFRMGMTIRRKGFDTAVVAGRYCNSGCALAWLAGRERLMDVESRIGFHAAAVELSSGILISSPAGNAVMGAYLRDLGITLRGIAYLAQAPHTGIKEITIAEASANGIAVSLMSTRIASRIDTGDSSAPKTSWATLGEWVQAGRHDDKEQAIAHAAALRRRNANTGVYVLKDGGFAVAVGPFRKGQGASENFALIAAGEAPKQSVVVDGERFDDHVWGHRPARAPSGAKRSPQ